MVEGQLYHKVNTLHQPTSILYIRPFIQGSFQSSKSFILLPDNEAHDKLTYTCNISAKPISYIRS